MVHELCRSGGITGLTSEQVKESRRVYGSNEVSLFEERSFFSMVVESFKDPMIFVLGVALLFLSFLSLLGKASWYECIGTAVAITVAVFVSTVSEYKNESRFRELLKRALSGKTIVRRDGGIVEISVDDVVTGDIVILSPGAVVPADGVVISGSCTVSTASITGESKPVTLVQGSEILRGYTVIDGEAVMEVRAVGMQTKFAKIASITDRLNIMSPLKVRLSALARLIAHGSYLGAVLVAVVYIIREVTLQGISSYELPVFLKNVVNAVILATVVIIVVVPEGLPMMIAFVLSLNMKRLLNDGILVRQMVGIETAGSMNVLVCDKTGTLTEGAYRLKGSIALTKDGAPNFVAGVNRHLRWAVVGALECYIDSSGNPVGGAFFDRQICRELDVKNEDLEKREIIERRAFTSERKVGIVITSEGVFVKGAPEKVIEMSAFYRAPSGDIVPFKQGAKSKITTYLERWFSSGARLIAGASGKDLDNLVFEGVLVFEDPIREDARNSVIALKKAGIRVVLATGDHSGTAVSVAKETGILSSDSDLVVSSEELRNILNADDYEKISRIRVIYRCTPNDKGEFVRYLRRSGCVVGMVGDGINDVSALYCADVGIALGSGAEVAREASAVVVMNDSISSIKRLVHYGRTAFWNIRTFIKFQLSVSISALVVLFIGPLIGYDVPFTPIQLLWVNLIMDSLAALAFSGEPPADRYLLDPPFRRDEIIVTKDMWEFIGVTGIFASVVMLTILIAGDNVFSSHLKTLTVMFSVFVLIQNFNKFNCRAVGLNIFRGILKNKLFLPVVVSTFVIQFLIVQFGGEIFRTTPLTLIEWGVVFLFCVWIIPIDVLRKILSARRL
ncbi:MAG: calcium-translocating P-type ATPase, PMCA-type [Thermoproteota archaeon]